MLIGLVPLFVNLLLSVGALVLCAKLFQPVKPLTGAHTLLLICIVLQCISFGGWFLHGLWNAMH